MDLGFEWIAQSGGLTTEDYYPYHAKNEECDAGRVAYKVATTKGHQDVQKNSDEQFIAALQRGPLSVAIEADQSTFQFYKQGVFNGTCGTRLDHGVTAVGYAPDYYLVKNSWGTKWGEEGYIRMARNMPQDGGQCGILLAASFPTGCSYLNPGPAPPVPTTTAPSGEPYSDPALGECQWGQYAYSPQEGGSYCTQDCDSTNLCPDAPDGVNAMLTGCAMFNQKTGGMVCGVFCEIGNDNACDPSKKFTCKEHVQGIAGICTYDD